MKSRIFVDSSAWYALIDADDVNYRAARGFLKKALKEYFGLVISNHVMGETYTILRFRLGHAAAMEFIRRIRYSPRVEKVFINQSWEEEAYGLLEKFQDQDFSFIDATSFVAMKALDIKEAFAFDSHFATAGFFMRPKNI